METDVDEMETEPESHRAQIALRNRRRHLEDRERRLSMAVFGLMAYSAFANIWGGLIAIGTSTATVVAGLILGAAYLLGVYRVWNKDDVRWWPVAVPAGISIGMTLLAWVGGTRLPLPLLLNGVLLGLVPIRARASAALAAVPNNSFKPKPLRGSA